MKVEIAEWTIDQVIAAAKAFDLRAALAALTAAVPQEPAP